MQRSQIKVLLDLAEAELESATTHLGKMTKNRDQAIAQLDMLVQYQDDYKLRLQNTAQKGLSVAQFANFQAFINKLDQAIDGQKKIILDAEYRVKAATEQWQECEKKRLIYQELDKKEIELQQQKEAKREQKQTDETASRLLFYKRSQP
ncbi:flagellar export protein FliJ [Undibacterium cyanobacteriorum]|uniref:Flagellar FliJ protein n=1 Tax=Undibacterium cyanobacteriorum TaxID=3073561 RepID=A0ABY9RNE0_9BURK|nr:flagellar export protein FliJ [Undibacterium sp. 20NA77.5]WMW82215.1 flagellar export protein FliJ [Undibacterium sp. 20NA77.5]